VTGAVVGKSMIPTLVMAAVNAQLKQRGGYEHERLWCMGINDSGML